MAWDCYCGFPNANDNWRECNLCHTVRRPVNHMSSETAEPVQSTQAEHVVNNNNADAVLVNNNNADAEEDGTPLAMEEMATSEMAPGGLFTGAGNVVLGAVGELKRSMSLESERKPKSHRVSLENDDNTGTSGVESPAVDGDEKVSAKAADGGCGKMEKTKLSQLITEGQKLSESEKVDGKSEDATSVVESLLCLTKGQQFDGIEGIELEPALVANTQNRSLDTSLSTFKTELEGTACGADAESEDELAGELDKVAITVAISYATTEAKRLGHEVPDVGQVDGDIDGGGEGGVDTDVGQVDGDSDETVTYEAAWAFTYVSLCAILQNGRLKAAMTESDLAVRVADLMTPILTDLGLTQGVLDQVGHITTQLVEILNMESKTQAKNSVQFSELPETLKQRLTECWGVKEEEEECVMEEEGGEEEEEQEQEEEEEEEE